VIVTAYPPQPGIRCHPIVCDCETKS